MGLKTALPVMFHWGRQDSSVAFYGCKIAPEDVQHALVHLAQTMGSVANFALHPYEDADANKRLELWLEWITVWHCQQIATRRRRIYCGSWRR